MTKILSYKNERDNVIIVASLIISIVITNSFVIFSPDKDTRFYNASLASIITVGLALVICIIQVYRYKRSGIKKLEKREYSLSKYTNSEQPRYYYNNNKMHFSICLFLALWFAAHAIWTFQYQQSSAFSIDDVLWFVGYGLFGYFLYSLYYHFFRREFEPFLLILIAIIIIIVLVFIVDVIVSTLRLLSTQTIDISVLLVTIAYPILDAILIFPAILIFWAARKVSSRHRNATLEQKMEANKEEDKSSPSLAIVSSIWILLLCIAMILSAIGDTGFAYSTAYGTDIVQRDVWIFDIFYNAAYLCLAASLIGYRYFFSFSRTGILHY